jgi:hypothetical protein
MQQPFRFAEQFDLFKLWSSKRGARAMPDRAALTTAELRPWLGSIHLLEVIERGRDFRYLVYGTDIARHYDVEMTRKLVTDWPRHRPRNLRPGHARCVPLSRAPERDRGWPGLFQPPAGPAAVKGRRRGRSHHYPSADAAAA